MKPLVACLAPAALTCALLVHPDPAAADVIVRMAPPAPVVEVAPRAPAAGYVWRPGYWSWVGGRYVWVRGVYVVAPRAAAVWVPGRWVARPRGWVWVGGHWR